MATNHASDFGYIAIKNTLLQMRERHPDVPVLGLHDSEEDQKKITVVEKNGISIALLNYTYGTNTTSAVNEAGWWCIDYLTKDRVTSDVQRAKEMADFVVVFPHWGEEYQLEPNWYQKDYVNLFLELGVDAVVGAHPHCGQPMQWYTREDGSKMVVYYSLGNFLSIFRDFSCELEGMAYLQFYKDENGKHIEEGTIIPLVNHWIHDTSVFGSRTGYRVYALQDYTEELANSHGTRYYNGNGFTLNYLKDLAARLWGENIKTVDFGTEN